MPVHNGLLGFLETNDFDGVVVYMQNTALNTTGSNGATAGDGAWRPQQPSGRACR